MTESYLSGTKGSGSERTSEKSVHDFLAVTEGEFSPPSCVLVLGPNPGPQQVWAILYFQATNPAYLLFKKMFFSLFPSFSLITLICLPRFEIGSYTVAQAGLKLTIFYLSLLRVQIPDR